MSQTLKGYSMPSIGEHNVYLKYKMVAVRASRQNRGFDARMN